MQDSLTAEHSTPQSDDVTLWFLVLRRAHLEGNHERAADAIRKLRGLGVEVRFRAKPRRELANA